DAQPTSTLFYPTDLYPFTDLPEPDPDGGPAAGLLDRARADGVAPKVFFTNTSYEYWGRGASLVHTSPDGARDAPIGEGVRVYFFAGLQHFTAPFPPPADYRGIKTTHLQNPNPVAWLWRALFETMEAWVRDGLAPPESRIPKLADGTLVAVTALSYPKIPTLPPPARAYQPVRLDFGPDWKR